MSTEPEASTSQPVQAASQLRLALITAGAALVGAAVGGLAAFGASAYQADSQRDLAFRQERQAAYAELNVAFTEYLDATGKLRRVAAGDQAALAKLVDDVCAKRDALVPSYSTVQLVGPDEVAAAAGEAAGAATKECDKAREKAPLADDDSFFFSYLNFLDAAQHDLGTGD